MTDHTDEINQLATQVAILNRSVETIATSMRESGERTEKYLREMHHDMSTRLRSLETMRDKQDGVVAVGRIVWGGAFMILMGMTSFVGAEYLSARDKLLQHEYRLENCEKMFQRNN